MPFAKGQSGNPSGKKPGQRNRLTISVKEAFEAAFRELQGDEDVSLKVWAKDNPTEFYKLAAKLIPSEITGKDGGAFEIRWVDPK